MSLYKDVQYVQSLTLRASCAKQSRTLIHAKAQKTFQHIGLKLETALWFLFSPGK